MTGVSYATSAEMASVNWARRVRPLPRTQDLHAAASSQTTRECLAYGKCRWLRGRFRSSPYRMRITHHTAPKPTDSPFSKRANVGRGFAPWRRTRLSQRSKTSFIAPSVVTIAVGEDCCYHGDRSGPLWRWSSFKKLAGRRRFISRSSPNRLPCSARETGLLLPPDADAKNIVSYAVGAQKRAPSGNAPAIKPHGHCAATVSKDMTFKPFSRRRMRTAAALAPGL